MYYKKPHYPWKKLKTGESVELSENNKFSFCRNSDEKLNSTFSIMHCSVKEYNDFALGNKSIKNYDFEFNIGIFSKIPKIYVENFPKNGILNKN